MREVNPRQSPNPFLIATEKYFFGKVIGDEIDKQASDRYGRNNNCAYCTLAYDMRRKGYDVEASSVSYKTANTPYEIESWYKGGKFQTTGESYANKTSEQASRDISNTLAQQGNGARGQFCMFWKHGGGHSISYEVEDGNVIYRDCQHNRVYKNEEINEYLQNANLETINYMRTDNLEFSEKALNGVKPKKRRKK